MNLFGYFDESVFNVDGSNYGFMGFITSYIKLKILATLGFTG